MKKRMGFTLVELMGILVVLAIILLVTVPSITKTFQGTEKNNKERYKESLCDAARTYTNLTRDRDDVVQLISINGKELELSAAELIEAGYLPDNFKNPKKGSTDAGTKVKLKNNNSKVECVSYTGL